MINSGAPLFLTYNQQKSKVLVTSSNEEKAKEYKKIEPLMRRWLTSENTTILSGAGSSIGEEGTGGQTMETLWSSVKSSIGEKDFTETLELVNFSKDKEDLEELLSRLVTKKTDLENSEKKKEAGEIEEQINNIKDIIRKECSFKLGDIGGYKHTVFLQKLLNARKKTAPRVKIFTLNYDTIFEQAAKKTGTILIDGFSLTQEEFSGVNFDLDIVKRDRSRVHNEENFYSNVIHLYKLHGSINWEYDKGLERIIKNPKTKSPLLIYPNSQKYEESYSMPFFEMISRFQMELRKQNVCLLILGYGFNDAHINRVLDEAMNSNFNLEIIIVNPSITHEDKNKDNPHIKNLYRRIKAGNNNITLVGDTFSNFITNLPTPQFEQMENLEENNEDKSI